MSGEFYCTQNIIISHLCSSRQLLTCQGRGSLPVYFRHDFITLDFRLFVFGGANAQQRSWGRVYVCGVCWLTHISKMPFWRLHAPTNTTWEDALAVAASLSYLRAVGVDGSGPGHIRAVGGVGWGRMICVPQRVTCLPAWRFIQNVLLYFLIQNMCRVCPDVSFFFYQYFLECAKRIPFSGFLRIRKFFFCHFSDNCLCSMSSGSCWGSWRFRRSGLHFCQLAFMVFLYCFVTASQTSFLHPIFSTLHAPNNVLILTTIF